MLDETEVVMHTENDFAPVAYLRIKRASLHPKESSTNKKVEVTPLLEDRFAELKDTVESLVLEVNSSGGAYAPPTNKGHSIPDRPLIRAIESWLAVGNIHKEPSLGSEITLDHEVRDCFLQLQGIRFANSLVGLILRPAVLQEFWSRMSYACRM